MVIFAAATGLRPSELFGLERRDVDLDTRVVYVRRAFANRRLKPTKTRLSDRAVPLQAKALEALDQLPSSSTTTTATSPTTAARVPSRFSTRSRSNGRWTLGGRRPQGPQTLLPAGFPRLLEGGRGAPWTLGGHRGPDASPPEQTEETDHQGLREAL
jgi:integrase